MTCIFTHFPTKNFSVFSAMAVVFAIPPNARRQLATTKLPDLSSSSTCNPELTIAMSSSRRRACLYPSTNSNCAKGNKQPNINNSNKAKQFLVVLFLSSLVFYSLEKTDSKTFPIKGHPTERVRTVLLRLMLFFFFFFKILTDLN